MSKVGEAYVEVRANTSKFEKELTAGVDDALDKVSKTVDDAAKGVNESVDDFGTKFKAGIGRAAIASGVALAGIGVAAKRAVGAASDLGESINAVNVVFGRASEGILSLSRDAATAVGLSQTEFNSMAVQFSSFAEKIAGPGGDIVSTIESISLRAADFASVMNLEVADAARIFQSGLAGETEPLKKFGIDLSEAAVKAYAVANGIGAGRKELTEQDKVLARYGALMEQTNKTQGDFANTSDSLANRQRIVGSQFKDLQASIGERLIPVFETLLGFAQDFISWADENQTTVYIMVGAIAALAVTIIAVNTALKVQAALGAIAAGVQGAYALITGKAAAATAAQAAATGTATAAQVGLNTAMSLNPIGLIVVAVAALIAVFVILYKKVEGFRKIVNTVVNAVIGYFEFMVNVWIYAINMVTGAINGLTGVLGIFGIKIPKIAKIAEVEFGRIGDAADKAAQNTSGMTKAQIENMEVNAILADRANDAATGLDKVGGASSKAAEAAKKAADRIKKLRDQLGEGFKSALEKATGILDDARNAYQEFAVAVNQAVTSSFSFQDAYDAGEETGSGFFSALQDQATKIQDFSVLINRLMAAGLSEQALQQVLDAGVGAGSAIAEEILSSADGVIRANNLVAQVASIGDNIGTNAATKFRQAGVDAGTALVAGINDVVSKYRVSLKSKNLTAKQLKKLKQQFAVDVEFMFGGGGLPELANGAIVGSRTPAIIGEAGPEAVIPITRPARALQLMEQTGLASLARGSSAAAVNIENATFVAPVDADLVAQKVLVAERARSFG